MRYLLRLPRCFVSFLSWLLLLCVVAVIIVTVIMSCAVSFELCYAMQCSSRLLQFVFQIKHAQVFHCRRQFATKNKHKHFECAVRTNTGTIVHYNNPKYCGHCCNCPVHVRMCACIRYVKSETKLKKTQFSVLFLEKFAPFHGVCRILFGL